jgi:hypothetical protein
MTRADGRPRRRHRHGHTPHGRNPTIAPAQRICPAIVCPRTVELRPSCGGQSALAWSGRGKGRTSRTVFLGLDAQGARADDLTRERPADADEASAALFLAAASIPTRRPDRRLSPRSVDSIVAEVGRVHGLEVAGVDASSPCCVRTTAPHVRVPALGGVAAQPGWTRTCSASCVEVRRRDDEGRCAARRGGMVAGLADPDQVLAFQEPPP